MPKTDIRVAQSSADLEAAHGLIYRKYLDAGYVDAGAEQTVMRPGHGNASTDVLVASQDGAIVCTLTIFADGLPLSDEYANEVRQLSKDDQALTELGCFAGTSRSVVLINRLFNLATQRSIFRGLNPILAAVHPKHARFYKRMFGFEVVAGPRAYYKANGHPSVLLKCDLERSLAGNSSQRASFNRAHGEPFPISKIVAQPAAWETRPHVLPPLIAA